MLSACGITSFLNPLSPPKSLCGAASGASASASSAVGLCATGDIKESPEDFVVVEVDPAGQRTDAATYVFPSTANTPAPSIQREAEDGSGGSGDGGEADATASLAATPAPSAAEETRSVHELQALLVEHAPALKRLFGSVSDIASRATTALTHADLTSLIADLRLSAQGAKLDTPLEESEGATPSSPRWWRGRHVIGDFPDKGERQLVHVLVRRCFPHLRSHAEPPPSSPSQSCQPATKSNGDVASCISCAVDLHYVLFCSTLGAEAAACIAQWSIAAQAARQERHLDEAARSALQAVTPGDGDDDDAAAALPASVKKGICLASFDPLTEMMHRPQPQLSPTSDSMHCAALIAEKDVRRQVHELLRRFYPFLNCQVREGRVTLRYQPKPDQAKTNTSTPALSATVASRSGAPVTAGMAIGVRRTRDEMESDGAAAAASGTTNSSPSSPSSVAATYLHFIVQKRNLDTAEMRQLVAEYIGLKDGAVCVAGMKDKKAVTTQRCSIPNTPPQQQRQQRDGSYAAAQLADVTPASPVVLRWPADPQQSYAMVLRASSQSSPVHLGQLKGNWFSVRVRRVRWAGPADHEEWGEDGEAESRTTAEASTSGARSVPADAAELRPFLESRFHQCVERGFVNYFGQQRFGETIKRADDHTGVHLFARRWVAAVRSLYRSCPEVYEAFPEKMEARFVPGNSRDAQAMTHALRQTYRMYFSEHRLTAADVQGSTALWTRVCEKAITEGVPFFLRSLWVHAGQSAFFNLAASFVVEGLGVPVHATRPSSSSSSTALPPLSYAIVATAQLPLGGYQVERARPERGEGHRDGDGKAGSSDAAAAWHTWQEAAIQHALQELHWTATDAFEQRKVAGVPVPGSWRAVVVQASDASLAWEAVEVGGSAEASPSLVHAAPTVQLSFTLPSSSYATVFLREVMGCNKWW